MNICFCIPARYNSSRLDKKLLLDLDGISCIERTIIQTQKSKYYDNNIYVLTDSEDIARKIYGHNVNVVLTVEECCNGTDRISKHLYLIDEKYSIVVNIQADEPFISPSNIDYVIDKHISDMSNSSDISNESNIFYTTLHEETNSEEYLRSTASLKLIVDNNNRVIYYSRNIIPWNKKGIITDFVYKTFTGIYVFNRNMLELYKELNNTVLQLEEDCEQLKIIESGYTIRSYPTVEYNEISMNTLEDYKYLIDKFIK